MLPIYKDESFMSLCRPLLDQQSSLEYTMKCQCETPMAKNCTNIFQKIKNKKRLYLHVIVIAFFILGTHIEKHYLLKVESF